MVYIIYKICKTYRTAKVFDCIILDILISVTMSSFIKRDCYMCFFTETSTVGPSLMNEVQRYLTARGLSLGFPSEESLDTVSTDSRRQLFRFIDSCQCAILFLTKSFLSDKLHTRSIFGYIMRSKGRHRIILCVLEEDIADASQWDGDIGTIIRGKKFVDISRWTASGYSSFYLRGALDQLYDAVVKTIDPVGGSITEAPKRSIGDPEVEGDDCYEDINVENLEARLYADLSLSAPEPPTEGSELCRKVVRDLEKVKKIITGVPDSMTVIPIVTFNMCSLVTSIVSLNISSKSICNSGIRALALICRYGKREDVGLVVKSGACKVVISITDHHIMEKAVVESCAQLSLNIMVSSSTVDLMYQYGVVTMTAKVLNLYYMEADIVRTCASVVSKLVGFDRDINTEFGRLSTCELLVTSLRYNHENELMADAVFTALLDLSITEENKAKMRSVNIHREVERVLNSKDQFSSPDLFSLGLSLIGMCR